MKITRRQLRRVIREAMDAQSFFGGPQLNRPFSQPDRNVEPKQLWDNVIGKIFKDRGINRQGFLEDWDSFVRFLTKFTMNSKPREKHLTPAEASKEIGSRIARKIIYDERWETSDEKGRRQIYADATIKTLAEILRAMNYVPDREEDLQATLGL